MITMIFFCFNRLPPAPPPPWTSTAWANQLWEFAAKMRSIATKLRKNANNSEIVNNC